MKTFPELGINCMNLINKKISPESFACDKMLHCFDILMIKVPKVTADIQIPNPLITPCLAQILGIQV